MSFHITTEPTGHYIIQSDAIYFRAQCLSPKIENEDAFTLSFGPGKRERMELGGVGGTLMSDLSRTEGIDVHRDLFLSDDGRRAAIRMRISNQRNKPFALSSMMPIFVNDPADFRILGTGLSDWRIVRMGRQKGDMPTNFRFSPYTPDLEEAAFDASELTAGMGFDKNMVGTLEIERIEAEPCLHFVGAKDGRDSLLFFGTIGQNRHISSFITTPNADRSELKSFESLCEFDGVIVDPGESRETHWILIAQSEDESTILSEFTEIYAREFNIPKPARPPLTVYCSWQFYGLDFLPSDLEENLAELKKRPIPVEAFQLDNGWMDYIGDYEANFRFPDGMKAIADQISAAGYIPGIWTCPLVIDSQSRVCKEHPDLIAKDVNGEPVHFKYGWATAYTVDPTSPSFEEYVRTVYAKLIGWGYRYHKLDFLRSVFVDDSIRFHDRKCTRAEAFRRAMALFREVLSDGVYFCSCGGVMDAANAPHADSVRTSSDTFGFWYSPNDLIQQNALRRIKQNLMRSYTNRLWRVDPDAPMIRRRNTPLRPQVPKNPKHLVLGLFSDEEAFTMIAHNYLAGGNICVCERLAELDDDRRALFRHVIPSMGVPAKILHYDWARCPNFFLTEVNPAAPELRRWWTLAVANWEDEPIEQSIDLSLAALPEYARQVAVFELRQQEYVGIKNCGDTFSAFLPPHSIRIFRLAPWTGEKPILLGTDLHLSGGGVEIDSIQIGDKSLSGTIRTEWDYPVKLTALFPFEGRERLRTAWVIPPQRRFELMA